MKVTVNGKEMDMDGVATVGAMLERLEIGLAGTAVEVNREIVPKRVLGETPLKDGDVVEVIRMVGGG